MQVKTKAAVSLPPKKNRFIEQTTDLLPFKFTKAKHISMCTHMKKQINNPNWLSIPKRTKL